MKATIFYFSGTGNTWFIAESLRKGLFIRGIDVDCYSIEDSELAKTGAIEQLITESSHIIIGYPIYGSVAPRPMIEFIERFPKTYKNTKLSVFSTVALASGDGAIVYRDTLEDRGYTDIGVATSLEDAKERLTSIEENPIALGTAQLVRENLDVQDLDLLLLLSPFGKGIAGENNIQQSFGRILRPVSGKLPVVILMLDQGISKFSKQCRQAMRILSKWPKEKGGKIDYKIVPIDERPPIKRVS